MTKLKQKPPLFSHHRAIDLACDGESYFLCIPEAIGYAFYGPLKNEHIQALNVLAGLEESNPHIPDLLRVCNEYAPCAELRRFPRVALEKHKW
jgi:hypothetical protein